MGAVIGGVLRSGFVWSDALREMFNFFFSGVFANVAGILTLGGGLVSGL